VGGGASSAKVAADQDLLAKKLVSNDRIAAMLEKKPEPHALALELVEAANANAAAVAELPSSCSASSGYDHCQVCALPVMAELADQLVIVKSEIWTAQKARAASAASVCTSKYPADRIGGTAKCCSSSGTVSYAPFAYTSCAASTFSPTHVDNLHLSAVELTDTKGFFLQDGTVTSRMVEQCCQVGTRCTTNKDNYNLALREKMTEMNSHWADKVKDRDEKNAASSKFTYLTNAHAERKLTLLTLCRMAADPAAGEAPTTDELEARPASLSDAKSDCLSGHIREVSDREANRADKLHNDIQAIQRAVDIIMQVSTWLKSNGSELFSDRATTSSPSVDTYSGAVALLEKAGSSEGNTEAKEAFAKVTSLVESTHAAGAGDSDGGAHGGSAATQVIALIQEILNKLRASKAQTFAYEQQMVKDEAVQVSVLYKDMHSVWTQYLADLTSLAGIQLQATNYEDPRDDTMLDGYKGEWVDLWNLREQNSRKCMQFMTYYDSETLTNTGELLILKKAIDIIKNIGCGPNHLQTTSPTTAFVVPTLAPTPAPTPRCLNSEDSAQTALFGGVEGHSGELACVWSVAQSAAAGMTKRECQTHCLQTKFNSTTSMQQCLAMRWADTSGGCQITQTRNCDLYAETLAAGESIVSRDCFDIQQTGSIGTVRQPAKSYYPVCDASSATTASVNFLAGTVVPNTYVPPF
jgi:hypothetical protein